MKEIALRSFEKLIAARLEMLPRGADYETKRSFLIEAQHLVIQAISDRMNVSADRKEIDRKLARAMILAGEAGAFGELDGPRNKD